MSKETKWRYDRVEKAARVVGRARGCVRRSLAKAMLPLEEMNFGVTEFCASGGEACVVSIKVAQKLGVESGIKASHRHSQFWR